MFLLGLAVGVVIGVVLTIVLTVVWMAGICEAAQRDIDDLPSQ